MLKLPELAYAGCVLAVIGTALAMPSCRDEPQSNEPVAVSPEGLFRTFRDTPRAADSAWTGHIVRIRLRAREYRVSGRTVLWHDSYPESSPALVFDIDRILPDNSAALEIIGTCRGKPGREVGHVHLTDCRVQTLP